MKDKRPALGKGLSALFPVPTSPTPAGPAVLECPVDRIDAAPDQPRRAFADEALRDLAASIQESGVLQPLLVTREGDRYRLIAGERRLRAARLAGLAAVPIMVRQATAQDSFLLALVENLQREDLNPVEEARAYQRLVTEFGLTQEEVAKRVGRQRSTVANCLRLLKLSEPVLRALESGAIQEGIARALLPLEPAAQAEALSRALEGALNTREVEAMVRSLRVPEKRLESPVEPALSSYFAGAREEIEEALGVPVSLSFRGNRGRIGLTFRSLAEFRELRERLATSAAGPEEPRGGKTR